MRNAPIRLGIVGLGFGAKVQIPAFLACSGATVRGVTSRNLKNAQSIAESIPGCLAFEDWKTLVESDEIDAVCVSTPPNLHAEIVLAAIQNEKHVLCEKPFGMTTEEAQRLAMAAEKSTQLICGVDFEFRFEPAFEALRAALRSGQIGDLTRIEVKWLTSGRAKVEIPWSWQNDLSSGGGVKNAFLSHVFDYLAWFSESDITEVSGSSRISVSSRKTADGILRDVTAEDLCEGRGKLRSGVMFAFEVSNAVPNGPGHRIELIGTKGRLVFESIWPFDFASTRVTCELTAGRRNDLPLVVSSTEDTSDTRILPFRRLAESFIQSIRNGKTSASLPTFADGLRVRNALSRMDRGGA